MNMLLVKNAVGYGYYFLRRRALLPGERDG